MENKHPKMPQSHKFDPNSINWHHYQFHGIIKTWTWANIMSSLLPEVGPRLSQSSPCSPFFSLDSCWLRSPPPKPVLDKRWERKDSNTLVSVIAWLWVGQMVQIDVPDWGNFHGLFRDSPTGSLLLRAHVPSICSSLSGLCWLFT